MTRISSWPRSVHSLSILWVLGFPGGSEVKASAWNAGDPGLIPGLGRSPGEGNGSPLQYSWKSHGWRSLVGYSPWGGKESDTAEQLHFDFRGNIFWRNDSRVSWWGLFFFKTFANQQTPLIPAISKRKTTFYSATENTRVLETTGEKSKATTVVSKASFVMFPQITLSGS